MVHERKGEEGFALIAALMVFWVLTALGMLVFSVTTQDVRVSSRTVGERKAFAAAQSGLHYLTQTFDAANPSNSATSSSGVVVDATSGDPNTKYIIAAPSVPTTGPTEVPIAGYAMGGGETWGRQRFLTTVTGTNTAYNSTVQVNVGIGYGPVDVSTVYR
jgi:Tfp pilus assembly protein PilX